MRRTFDREFYRPTYSGAEPFTPEGTDLEVWMWDEGSRSYLTVFGGKRSKPDSAYYYMSEKSRQDALDRMISTSKANIAYKEEQRVSRAKPHTLKVGDILKMSWGYDQTNIDYFEVIELTGKTMVVLEEIGQKTVRSERGADYVKPEPAIRTGKIMKKKARANNSVYMASYADAYLCDPDKESYQTAIGWGH